MRFPNLFSIRSNDSTVRHYDNFGDEDEESLPPPPPPLSTPSSPQTDPSSQTQWSPDDVSAMTAPSGLGTMSNVETNDRTPSKESEGERYVVDGFPPSPAAAVELELAIYERIEKARKMESDLSRDEQNRRDSRKRRVCVIAILLLAVLVLSVGLSRGLNRRTVDAGNSKNTPSDRFPTNDKEMPSIDPLIVKTDGPFISDDLGIMLVGLTSPSISSDATNILEKDYCAFFSDYYNNPREMDWLRSNVDIAECSVEALETNRRRLNEDSSTSGLIVELNQTLTLAYPNAGNFTYIKASMDYVVSAPFKDEISVASLVEKLKKEPETDEFSDLKDIRFAPEPVTTTDSQAPVSMMSQEPSTAPYKVPTTRGPTENPTAQPTNLPWKEEKDEKGKDKDKKKNAKGKA